MEWLRNLRGKNNSKADPQPGQEPSQPEEKLDDQEMEKSLDLFMRTCWPSNYGEATLGVDIQALQNLQGPYLKTAKAVILESLKRSPDNNPILAATAIEMTEAIPIMTGWIQQVRSQEDKSEAYAAHSRLAYSLYSLTKDEAYLADLAEAVRVSGFSDISGTQVTYPLWKVPLTIDALSAVWEKLKKGKAIREHSSWRETCEDFLREKLDDPVGQAFLKTLSETEQKEVLSAVALTRNQRIERNRRFEEFVVDRYNKGDLNRYGEYIKVSGSPLPGLTLRCILEGHTKEVNSISWSPDGSLLASAGSDNLIVIWDVKKGDFISIIDGGEIDRNGLASGHDWDNNIWCMAWSTDGEWIAFGAEKKNVSIWDVKEAAFIIPPKIDGSTVRDLAWEPGQKSLLYSLSDDTVWIKDIPSGKVRQVFKGCNGRFDALTWSSDAAFIAAGYWDRNKHGNANQGTEEAQPEILLWDVKKEKIVTRLASQRSYINHISWMPDQPILAAASADGTIGIWNMQQERRIISLESHTSSVTGVSFSAGGVLLASTAEKDEMIGGTVRLWRTDSWEELIILKELDSAEDGLAFHQTLPILATRCHGIVVKPSMNNKASCIRIWDLDFEAFLSNQPFTDEFNQMEAEIRKQEQNAA